MAVPGDGSRDALLRIYVADGADGEVGPVGVGLGAGGWLVFAVPYDALARGENLLGIGALGRELRVEKVEVRVCCTEVL